MSLGVFQIIKQALTLPTKNMKLILQVLLIYAITTMFLTTINQFSTFFLLKDISKKYTEIAQTDPTDPAYYKLYQAMISEIREVAIIEVIFVILSFFISTILMIISIYAFALTYTNNYITLKELLHKVKANLKGPIITQILTAVFNIGYMILLVIVIGLLWFIGSRSVLMVAFIAIVLIVAIIGWFYLAIWWLLGSIVSVNEEGCYGIGAFKRASQLTKGRMCTGVWIYLVYTIISSVFFGVFGFVFGSASSNVWTQMVVQWVEMVLVQVITFFFMAAMTVYYCECKKAVDEHFGNTVVYSSLSTADNV